MRDSQIDLPDAGTNASRLWNATRAKIAVVLACSVVWALVSMARTPDALNTANDMNLDSSWVIGLAASLQQGMIAGRDFQFTYGPIAQLVAWAGAAFNQDVSAFPALRLIVLSFWLYGIFLFAVTLLILDFVDWKAALLIYSAAALLNLFSEPTSFRTLTLLAGAAILYRSLSAGRTANRALLAVLAGVFALLAQLTTIELALYSVAMIVLSCSILASLSMAPRIRLFLDLKHPRTYLVTAGIAMMTLAIGNGVVSLLFRLTGDSYGRLFDYQRFSLEIVRGYNLTMGSPWALGNFQTIVLVAIIIYTAGAAGLLLISLGGRDAHWLLVLSMCSLAALKGAMLRSDAGHITVAAGPAVFLFLLLGAYQLKRWRTAAIWLSLGILLSLVWPWSGLYSLNDVLTIVSGRAELLEKLGKLRGMRTSTETLPEGMAQALAQDMSPIMNFPYEIYIASALNRPLAAPVLQAYAAHTPALQDYYVESLKGKSSELTVTYGLDNSASQPIDSVQNITRLPIIFEHLYRGFELRDEHQYGPGFYILKPRLAPFPMTFSSVAIASNDGRSLQRSEIHSQEPASCTVVRLSLVMRYPWSVLLGRPAAATVTFLQNDRVLQSTRLVALENAREFSTLISLVDPPSFYRLFGSSGIQSVPWDTIRIEYPEGSLLDVAPSTEVKAIECLNRPA